MGWLTENWRRILGIALLYLLFPAIISASVRVLAMRFRLFDWDTADNVFDFLADIMYPWRWKKNQLEKRERHMKTVTLYTDGACSGNPGPGGWGAVPQKMLRIFRGPLFDFMFRRAEVNSALAARHLARALPRVQDGPQEALP